MYGLSVPLLGVSVDRTGRGEEGGGLKIVDPALVDPVAASGETREGGVVGEGAEDGADDVDLEDLVLFLVCGAGVDDAVDVDLRGLAELGERGGDVQGRHIEGPRRRRG